jgi:small subunit ribosomal protein S17
VGERKNREGVVVSDAMQKTRVVKIERVFRHPRYQLIEETRPMSKEKRWRIRKVLTRVS